MVHHADRMPYVSTLAAICQVRAVESGLGDHHPPITPEMLAVYDLIRHRVIFSRDPIGVELPRSPDQLAATILDGYEALGDCDCVAGLGASMLRLLGERPALIVMGRRAGRPYEHIYYGAVGPDGRVIPFDPQERVEPGREVPAVRRKEYRL